MSETEEEQTQFYQVPDPDDARLHKSHAALIVLQGAEIGRDFRLRNTGMVVGRGLDADIRLPDSRASRKHACVEFQEALQYDERKYVLRDLSSTNHTFVNSRPVSKYLLRDGDKIQIGDTLLKFVLLDEIEINFHAQIRNLIHYDQLTGLLTLESLYIALEREMERCLNYNMPLTVLMMDLDFFKAVNDGYGHLMGSHVLSEVGELIRQSVRISDVSARYGGEEFLSYLAETNLEGGQIAAERIRSTIDSHTFTFDKTSIHVSISIGIATAPQHGRDINGIVAAADKALYRAKETGRNRVCIA